MTCFLKKWLWVTGIEGLGGIGALELNTQHCDETKCKIHERDRLRIQYEPEKDEQMGPGHRNRTTQV